MDEAVTSFSRRNLFLAGGVGAVAAIGLAGSAQAAETTATEKANIKLVEDFCKSWNDPDKSVAYLAPEASVRMVEDQPAVVGPVAVAAAFKGFMSHGEKIGVKILATFAKGPVVVNHRVDTLTTPGKPEQQFPVVGVFVVKNGKIKEWADYLAA
jgi:limonene-1,2-epoxide hydrolase